MQLPACNYAQQEYMYTRVVHRRRGLCLVKSEDLQKKNNNYLKFKPGREPLLRCPVCVHDRAILFLLKLMQYTQLVLLYYYILRPVNHFSSR